MVIHAGFFCGYVEAKEWNPLTKGQWMGYGHSVYHIDFTIDSQSFLGAANDR